MHTIFVTGVAVWLCAAAAAQCPPRYTVQVVHAPPCQLLAPAAGPAAMNGLGQMVGGYRTCGVQGAFVWTTGSLITPLNLGSNIFGSAALAINNAGQIAGNLENGVARTGFLYHNGTTTLLGTLPGGTYSEANGIAEDGTIVGTWGNNVTGKPASSHAFLWHDGQMIDLNVSPLIGIDHTGLAINNKHDVVGWMGVVPIPPFFGHAYLWTRGTTIDLGVPDDATNTVAYGLNDRGDVCGVYVVLNRGGSQPYYRQPCLWINRALIKLGVLPGMVEGYAFGINDSQQVIGYCIAPNQAFTAFLWQHGQMYALEKLIRPLGSNIHVKIARAINNAGQIVAQANFIGQQETIALILTPIPPAIGDVDCNDRVDMDDLLGVITRWSETSTPTPTTPGNPADLDGDGTVGLGDLVTVIEHWSH